MDPEVPVRYLRENFQLGDQIAVVLIQKQTHRVIQRIATVDKIGEREFQAWLRHANANRFEVYASMNTLNPGARSRTKEDIAAVRHIYLDFDHNGTAAVQSMIQRDDLPEPNYLVNSSSGKWQVIWKVEGFQQDEAERLMRQLVRELGADPAATDSSRVLRLPGFMNHKYGKPFLVRAESRSAATYTPEHFPRSLEDCKGSRSITSTTPGTGEARGISQSERDWAYAKRALARGDCPQRVVNAISGFRRGEKSDVLDYAERTVRKAQDSLASNQQHPHMPSNR
ncbi:MAG TPA: DNA-primase RepB domain-containing protein [Bryobacteraceae bacterium]|nr:DNA-primase RepB domain-containing protein [Bryobacteraceae bacterium]